MCDCDEFTREFFVIQKKPQGPAQAQPMDSFAQSLVKKPKVKDDNDLKEFMEKSLGGGRVAS